MMSLWGDGWFYICAGGFLVSSVLFVFLLGQYRAAVEAEEEPEIAAEAPAAEKVYVPRPIEPNASPNRLKDVADTSPTPIEPNANPNRLKDVAAAAPTPAEPAPAPKSKAESTGGLSPAVVYLQNLKTQMDHLDKEVLGLRALAAQQSEQGDMILQRLAELVDRLEKVEAPPVVAAAAAQAPVVEAAPKLTSAPEPAPVPVAFEPPPAAAQSAAAEKTVIIEPIRAEANPDSPKDVAAAAPAPAAALPIVEPPVVEAPAPAPQPEEKTPEPAPEASIEVKPARKGPVWPI